MNDVIVNSGSGIQIGALAETTSVTNTDVIPIQTTSGTKKVNVDNLLGNTKNEIKILDNRTDINNFKGWKYAVKSNIRPTFTFISDDCRREDLTKLAPLFLEKGVKGVGCAIASQLIKEPHDNTYLTTDEVLKLQNEYGWDIESHSYSHLNTATLTDSEIEREVGDSFKILNGLGIKAKSIIYPFGSYDERVKQCARKYYNAGVRVEGGYNSIPLETYNIRRITFDSIALDTLKQQVDSTIANNGWSIFMMHSAMFNATNNDLVKLGQLIDYIKSKTNCDILGLQEGLNRFGNAIDIGNYNLDNNRNPTHSYFCLGADGELYSDNHALKTINSPNNFLNKNINPKTLKENACYICKFTTGFDEVATGLAKLYTHKLSTPPPNQSIDYSYYMDILDTVNGFLFRSFYNYSTNVWSKFFQIDNINGSVITPTNSAVNRKGETIFAITDGTKGVVGLHHTINTSSTGGNIV